MIVSVLAVMLAFHYMQPKIGAINIVQLGGLYRNWMDLSYNITKQMQVILGQISDNKTTTDQEGVVANFTNTTCSKLQAILPR